MTPRCLHSNTTTINITRLAAAADSECAVGTGKIDKLRTYAAPFCLHRCSVCAPERLHRFARRHSIAKRCHEKLESGPSGDVAAAKGVRGCEHSTHVPPQFVQLGVELGLQFGQGEVLLVCATWAPKRGKDFRDADWVKSPCYTRRPPRAYLVQRVVRQRLVLR